VQSKQIIEILESKKCLIFLEQNRMADPVQLALNKQFAKEYPVQGLAEILHLYHKAQHKLPLWVENKCALSSKSYEQSSSEKTAKFKSKLVKGKNILNLTGGLGVDDYFFSKEFKQVDSVEIDSEVHSLADFNMQKMGVHNVNRQLGDSEKYLAGLAPNSYDAIFIDPDRRPDQNKRLFFLEHSLPNVLELKERMLSIAKQILIKASPMLDIQRACNQLENVTQVWVIAINNEVKELLFLLMPEGAVDKSPLIHAIDMNNNDVLSLDSEAKTSSGGVQNVEPNFFIEFSASILKANLQSLYAHKEQIEPCFINAGYGFAEAIPPKLMGRAFVIEKKIEFSKKKVMDHLKAHKIEKANVSKRNFPIRVDEIRQLLSLKTGGNIYLFFYKDGAGKKWMVQGVKP
jgi:hypothetical protein